MKIQLKFISDKVLLLGALMVGISAPLSAISLWNEGTNNEQSLFADPQASRVGDILTLIASETVSVSTSVGRTGAREQTITNTVNSFLFPSSNFARRKGELPSTDISTKRAGKNAGTATQDQTLSGRAAVRVVDVLPNGNLVVEGNRTVSSGGETYVGILRGIVRPEDIGRDISGTVNMNLKNIIYSQYVAEAQVEYVQKGALNDAQKEGWATRLWDKINPF